MNSCTQENRRKAVDCIVSEMNRRYYGTASHEPAEGGVFFRMHFHGGFNAVHFISDRKLDDIPADILARELCRTVDEQIVRRYRRA